MTGRQGGTATQKTCGWVVGEGGHKRPSEARSAPARPCQLQHDIPTGESACAEVHNQHTVLDLCWSACVSWHHGQHSRVTTPISHGEVCGNHTSSITDTPSAGHAPQNLNPDQPPTRSQALAHSLNHPPTRALTHALPAHVYALLFSNKSHFSLRLAFPSHPLTHLRPKIMLVSITNGWSSLRACRS